METRVTRVTAPLALAALVVLGNVWMAVIYAQGLARVGSAPGPALGAWGPFGFWGLFFGLLGLNNALALGAFGCWVAAVRREQQAQAEVLAALRWPLGLHWQQHLWLDAPAPTVRHAAPARLGWHLPYAAGMILALLLPATLLSLFFLR